MNLSCSAEDLSALKELIETSVKGGLYTEGGIRVSTVDLWKLLGGILLDSQKQKGDALGDAILWSLRRFLNSAVPNTALLYLQAVEKVLQNEDPRKLIQGERKATWKDVQNYLQNSCNTEEINVLEELISKGAIEGYEVLFSETVDKPIFQQDPMKVLPFNLHAGWIRTAEIELPLELTTARFVVADETVSEEEQVRFLQQLSRTGSPIILLCYRMDDALAEDLGRGWRDGWSKIIPFAAVDGDFSEEFRVNVLADTAWITGSSLCSYVSRTGLRDLNKGSKEISAAFPFVTIGTTYLKFLALGTTSGCRLRAGQLLSRLEAPDESAELLYRRAAYINGVAVQLLLPVEGSKILPSSLDLGVSVYKTFMDGVLLWEQQVVPFYLGMMAIEQSLALKELMQAENLDFLG